MEMNSSDNEGDNNDRISITYEINEDDSGEDDVTPELPLGMEAVEDGQSTDEEHFDITLAATHSYMGTELQDVSGRNVLEAGWRGTVPCMVHSGCVFPGETVPLLLLDRDDAATLDRTMKQDRLFALLCPDENELTLSGYGVLCEVFEAAAAAEAPARCKARAVHRCRVTRHVDLRGHSNMRHFEVVVLPEITLPDPLRPARLACLDAHRHGNTQQDRALRSLDALATPWPLFVFDIFDFGRMRDTIKEYFATLGLERMLPLEPVSLSFWVARNMTLAARDRLALFTVDNALLRLHMECGFISRKSAVCCSGCLAELARREHVFAMSSDGVHSTYTNPGGHMHDVVTVTRAVHVAPAGLASAEYSWFPGYAWTILMCSRCMAHVGWRFDALRRNLRPQRFFALCRNYAQPHDAPREGDDAPRERDDAPREGDDAPRERDDAPLHVPLFPFRTA